MGGAELPPADVAFGRLTLEDGLSQSSVYCLLQDRTGYLWVGTADGLNRYDGYSFSVYRRQANDSTSLSDNTISALCEDSLGFLWIGTMARGLNRLDPRSGRCIRYGMPPEDARTVRDPRIRALCTDGSGRAWAGTQGGGLYLIDPSTGLLRVFLHDARDSHSLAHNTVRDLLPDGEGLWIGTDGGGLCRLLWKNLRDQEVRFSRAQELGIRPSIAQRIESLYLDSAGRLWVGTVDQGALQIEFRPDKSPGVQRFVSRSSDPGTLSGDIVQAFCEDRTGAMWIGTWEGLNLLTEDSTTPTGYRIFRFVHDPTDPHSMPSNVVHALLLDRSGVLWAGTRSGGLSRFKPGPRKFALYKHDPRRGETIPPGSVRAICSDSLGFWVGTTGGGLARVYSSDGHVEVLTHRANDPRSLSSNDVRTLVYDHRGVLWVGTYGGGLNRVDLSGARPRLERVETPVPKDDEVFAFLEDRQHRFWAGTQNGVVRFSWIDSFPGRLVGLKHFSHDSPLPTRISHQIVRHLFEDDRGAVWIGTYGGLNRIDPGSDSVRVFLPDPSDRGSINSKVVVSAWQDSQGAVWFGTFGGGLNRYDYGTGVFSAIDESDGLPNAYVYGILGDRDGYLWLSTNKGLTRFQRSLWHPGMPPDSTASLFRTYDVRDGLQNNEFNAGAAHLSASGELFFGGIEGLNRFRPETVRDATFSPVVTVTGFTIFDRPVNLDSALAASGELVLAHDQNFFSFEVAALDFTNPQKNRYQYKLEGIDREWVRSGSRRYIAYTNLGYGTYTFRVRGTNSDGLWSVHEASVPLRIEPPFWHRWWFRFAGIFLAGALAAAVVGTRRRATRRAQEARERFLRLLIESQESERKRIAGELHDSLGQNLLIIKNKALLGLEADGGHASLLEDISTLAGQTINEVRSISYGLRPYQIDRLGLTKAIRAACRQIEESARIQLDASIDNIDGLLPRDLDINLYRIVQESLNNAVKHAGASHIDVTLRRVGEVLMLEVRDDGSGFVPQQALQQGSAGLGLSGIRERARMLGGSASVQSEPGRGTCVRATIPLRGDV